jgi:signal transduction histidine kinase
LYHGAWGADKVAGDAGKVPCYYVGKAVHFMKKNSSTRILLAASALVLATSLGLLWFVTARESARRDLLLEYEAFRASSAIVDEYRRDQSFVPTSDLKVLGFGFYASDGSAIKTFGGAPASIDLASLPKVGRPDLGGSDIPGNVAVSFPADGASIRLLRASGMGGPGHMGAPGMGLGMGFGMGRGRQGLELPAPREKQVAPQFAEPLSSLSVPYFTWIEYSAQGYRVERIELRLAAALISLALAGLYLLLFRTFRRNEVLKAREIETRELLQLGEAARTLVHEIKNPLGIMRIQTAKIRRAAQDGPVSESAEVIEGEILRLSGLADRIRDFLKSGQAKLEPIELTAFLKKFSERYSDLGDSGIVLALELPGRSEASSRAAGESPLRAAAEAQPQAVVEADGEKLFTALDDLLRNAIEAVEGQPEGKRRITIRLSGDDRFWRITVADSGPGIPEELAARIFDPFFTTKEKGSGIGLPLARSLIEACGGSLVCQGGQKGEGAVFVLSLRAL